MRSKQTPTEISAKTIADAVDDKLDDFEAQRIGALDRVVLARRQRQANWQRARRRIALRSPEDEGIAILDGRLELDTIITDGAADEIAVAKARPAINAEEWAVIGTLRLADGKPLPGYRIKLQPDDHPDSDRAAPVAVTERPRANFALRVRAPLPEQVYAHVCDIDDRPIYVLPEPLRPAAGVTTRLDLVVESTDPKGPPAGNCDDGGPGECAPPPKPGNPKPRGEKERRASTRPKK